MQKQIDERQKRRGIFGLDDGDYCKKCNADAVDDDTVDVRPMDGPVRVLEVPCLP